MGRFLAFLLVFVLGAIGGIIGGGFVGGAAGAYVGACRVIDKAVADGTMTQDQANALVRDVANDLEIKPEQKAQIIERLKKADQPASPCTTAIDAL